MSENKIGVHHQRQAVKMSEVHVTGEAVKISEVLRDWGCHQLEGDECQQREYSFAECLAKSVRQSAHSAKHRQIMGKMGEI